MKFLSGKDEMACRMVKIIPSLFVGWAVILFLVSSFLIPVSQAAPNESEAERTAKLVEGAKKEGKLLWYESMTVMQGNTMLKKFQEKYPFIKTALYRTTGESGSVGI